MNSKRCWVALAAVALAACGGPVRDDGSEVAADTSARARALEELSGAYDELAALLDRNPGEAVQWAQEDIENLGDWEYRIVEISNLSTSDLEAELNELGNERWEVFWMESMQPGVRVYLKRSSVSYLSRLPLSALARLLGNGGE